MMIILRDDPVIEIFASPDKPPNWIEAIDIENGEYAFCDEDGQRYTGIITQPAGWFRSAAFVLQPDGLPDMANAIAIVDRAVAIEPNDEFPDLASLRSYLVNRQKP
jgi:hypothetical protein